MNFKWVVKFVRLSKVAIIETEVFQSGRKGQIWIDFGWSIIWRIQSTKILLEVFQNILNDNCSFSMWGLNNRSKTEENQMDGEEAICTQVSEFWGGAVYIAYIPLKAYSAYNDHQCTHPTYTLPVSRVAMKAVILSGTPRSRTGITKYLSVIV